MSVFTHTMGSIFARTNQINPDHTCTAPDCDLCGQMSRGHQQNRHINYRPYKTLLKDRQNASAYIGITRRVMSILRGNQVRKASFARLHWYPGKRNGKKISIGTQASNLRHWYFEMRLLRTCQIEVHRGESVAQIGASAAGEFHFLVLLNSGARNGLFVQKELQIASAWRALVWVVTLQTLNHSKEGCPVEAFGYSTCEGY